MEQFKVRDQVYYDGQVGIVKSMHKQDGFIKEIKFNNSTLTGYMKKDVKKVNGYELVDNKDLVNGKDYLLVDVWYSISDINEGIIKNYKNIMDKPRKVELYDDYIKMDKMRIPLEKAKPIFMKKTKTRMETIIDISNLVNKDIYNLAKKDVKENINLINQYLNELLEKEKEEGGTQ